MLNYLKKYWQSWLIAFLTVAIFLFIAASTDAFQECMNHRYYESSDYEPPKGFAYIVSLLSWTQACSGEFLTKDGEAITAFFTFVLSVSTIGLWISTKNLWQTTTAAVSLANKEFVSTNRPRLRVRNFKLDNPVVGQQVAIQYEIVNVGATRARIIYHNIKIRLPFTEGRDKNAVELDAYIDTIKEIAGGEAAVSKTAFGPTYLDEWQFSVEGSAHAIGLIAYLDDIGVKRRTAFWRIYKGEYYGTFRFPDPPDDNREYED